VNVKVTFVAADGRATTIDARPGDSLMRAAVGAGVDGIAADCGGCLSCATCHVYVDDNALATLAPPSRDEDAMLEMTASPRQPNSRLSCQIVLDESLDGLRVQLPPSQY
jgi:2Fe-2S ferredoxin